MKSTVKFILLALALLNFYSCEQNTNELCKNEGPTLHEEASFFVGVAVDIPLIYSDTRVTDIVKSEFNSITPGNSFKPQYLQPQKDVFYFQEADALVEFSQQNNKRIHGHTLLWHNQLPDWLYSFQGDRAAWEGLMKNHIQSVVSHFKGKVTSWDVVNEGIDDDSSMRSNIWYQKIGPSYIEKAFLYAHEADPDALLFYNDYLLESNSAKRKAVIDLCNKIRMRGGRVDGIGLQMHLNLGSSIDSELVYAMQDVADHGYLLHLSEVDISINSLGKDISAPSESQLRRQGELMNFVTRMYQQIPEDLQYGITFWGVGDYDSWIRSFFGRQDFPLLFDDNYEPKPIYCSFKEAL